jgi:formylglycine-generating enzyme required for sulfatase activity
LWDWLYLPEQPQTEQYYWVWRFLCEMHPDGRDPEAWPRAVEPIYRLGDGTVEGTKRSSEMIYRAWGPLGQLVEEGIDAASDVQAKFLGEFENEILSGKRGHEAKEIADQFCASFIELPAGEFHMGAPPEKQGMPEDAERWWQDFLKQEGDPEDRAEQIVASRTYAPTKQGQELRDYVKQRLVRVLRSGDLDEVRRWQYPGDETPEARVQRVDGFLLSRWPTINRWYRLFRPGHGQVDSYYRDVYEGISPQPTTPVIFVTWYDAWAFCLWAHWQRRSCRLPREYEWEYAAKAGTPWDWNYWWGDDFDAEKCNAANKVGHTTPPATAHANPWGFEDMSGNVLEWCEDCYRERYDRDKPPESSARVLRGGSWNDYADFARSAYRNYGRPSVSENYSGFRVARAK